MSGIRLKCLKCLNTIKFETFFQTHQNCPNCGREWDFSNIKNTEFRRY